jgi:hypothetical protein
MDCKVRANQVAINEISIQPAFDSFVSARYFCVTSLLVADSLSNCFGAMSDGVKITMVDEPSVALWPTLSGPCIFVQTWTKFLSEALAKEIKLRSPRQNCFSGV